VTSVSPSVPTMTYLALPSPASVRATTVARSAGGTTGAATTVRSSEDAVELQPVVAVPPVTRQPQQADKNEDQAGNGGTGSAAVGQRTSAAGAAAPDQEQSSQPRVATGGTPGRSSTSFLTQSLSQEKIGAGLHIEPWQAALSSYLSAAALPASAWASSSVSLMV